MHQMHIFIKIVVISRFFKSRNSYVEKSGAQERLLAKHRKIQKYSDYKCMSHVDRKMTRHTLRIKHTDSTHTDSKSQKSKNSKINEKTSMNQV